MSTATEHTTPSGRGAEKLSLPSLQSKMKTDPEGYETELSLIYSQFNSAVDLFHQQAALSFASLSSSSASGVCADPSVAKDLGDKALFLAHVTPFYPKQLADKFPKQLAEFLKSSARSLPSGLRCHVTQALILLSNRQMMDISETLALFVELQTLGDKTIKKLAFSHVVHSIRKMNKKHKNDAKTRQLQNILFAMLQQENEAEAKSSLITLCELHRRRVWFDDRTANAICTACFHSSSRIMIAAVSFLLDFEKIEDSNDDCDASSSEDELNPQTAQVIISKEDIYKAHHKGTTSSKKKKQAKLQRAIRSMKRQQKLSSEKNMPNYYSPLNYLKDAQGFIERLFSRLQTCNERFEVKMMMLKVIARTVGLHRLLLLNIYPYLQKYCQPHQRDITNLLAAAIQTCHDMVPPDAVEPLFRQIVNQFVHDRSRPEAIAVGLNTIREICLRMPLLMTEDLLQDLVLYKKTHEKAVSAAARSLMVLFREVCPSLLVKKDRGRPSNPKARPKAYGESTVSSNIPGVELLQQDDEDDNEDHDLSIDGSENDEAAASSDNEATPISCESGSEDSNSDDQDDSADEVDDDSVDESDGDFSNENEEADEEDDDGEEVDGEEEFKKENGNKRKFSEFNGQLDAADTSLRALKRLTEEKLKSPSSDSTDGILSNEDFKRIKTLKAKKDAKAALVQSGFKLPNPDQISVKRVDPSTLEAHVRTKLSKEEKLKLVREGREETGKYRSRAATKKNKHAGSTNQEKEHKKKMPDAAKRYKIARNRREKKKKQQHSGKQFRGRKAWK